MNRGTILEEWKKGISYIGGGTAAGLAAGLGIAVATKGWAVEFGAVVAGASVVVGGAALIGYSAYKGLQAAGYIAWKGAAKGLEAVVNAGVSIGHSVSKNISHKKTQERESNFAQKQPTPKKTWRERFHLQKKTPPSAILKK